MFVACQSQSCGLDVFLVTNLSERNVQKAQAAEGASLGSSLFVWWGRYVLFTEIKRTG